MTERTSLENLSLKSAFCLGSILDCSCQIAAVADEIAAVNETISVRALMVKLSVAAANAIDGQQGNVAV